MNTYYHRECTTPTKLSLPCAMAPWPDDEPTKDPGVSLEVGSGYWGALFPAQGKQSDVSKTLRNFEIESGEHLPPDSISIFDVFKIITPLYTPREAGNFKISREEYWGRFKCSTFCFQISKFPNIWKSQGGVPPNYFQNFGSYWGPKILEPLTSKFWSLFQICVVPAHKGDIRASYAVPQVALNSRGSLDIGWAMANRRKRGAPSGSAFGGCIAWMNTRSINWPRCFDLSSSGTSTTQVVRRERNTERERERERERENQGVTENFEVSPVCVRKPISAWFSHPFLWYSSTAKVP